MTDRETELPTTEAYRVEREKLPVDLKEHYDSLVKWYRYLATVHHSHPFVSYKVLADLVHEGWRLSGTPTDRTD